jgi:hypothetical protein
MVPTVQVKLLGAVAVLIFGPVPLQIVAVAALVTDGFQLTVTVIVNLTPIHVPVVKGFTIYSTVPAALLGFVGLINSCT